MVIGLLTVARWSLDITLGCSGALSVYLFVRSIYSNDTLLDGRNGRKALARIWR